MCLGTIAVLHRDRGAVGGNEHLGTRAAGVGLAERVVVQLAGMNDLRHDVFGGQRGPQQMRHAAAGGKGGGDRTSVVAMRFMEFLPRVIFYGADAMSPNRPLARPA